MGQKWIIDVLRDLRAFAAANDLEKLEQQLLVTEQVAHEDLEQNAAQRPPRVSGHDLAAEQLSGGDRPIQRS